MPPRPLLRDVLAVADNLARAIESLREGAAEDEKPSQDVCWPASS